MRLLLVCVLKLWTTIGLGATADSQVPLPPTRAGQVFGEWLFVANHLSRESMAAFIHKYQWAINIDQEMMIEPDRGYEIVSIELNKPDTLVMRVKSHADGSPLMAKIVVTGTSGTKIVFLGLYDNPENLPFQPVQLDAKSNRNIVGAIGQAVAEKYFDRDAGDRMAKSLAGKVNAGKYDDYREGELLSEAVNDELHGISHDLHLNANFYLVPQPSSAPRVPVDPEQVRKGLARHNCGFVRAEHIDPNIGYLRFDNFSLPDACGETASAAMRFVADSEAIIFDLRQNGGGVPAMVTYLESYLFDKSTHLNDIYFRKDDEIHQFWTLPYVPGKRMATAPVFVLTSKNTFSAAEEFAYTLQALKRATVVGETTAGGAHPYDVADVNSHFNVEVPFARSINPVTKTDWEGTGVVPDVETTADDALNRAIALAKQSFNLK
jgi:hypothetical protein